MLFLEPGGRQNHEDIVSQSLDVALKTTLQGLSTFTRKRPRPPQTVVYVSSLVDNQHEKRGGCPSYLWLIDYLSVCLSVCLTDSVSQLLLWLMNGGGKVSTFWWMSCSILMVSLPHWLCLSVSVYLCQVFFNGFHMRPCFWSSYCCIVTVCLSVQLTVFCLLQKVHTSDD